MPNISFNNKTEDPNIAGAMTAQRWRSRIGTVTPGYWTLPKDSLPINSLDDYQLIGSSDSFWGKRTNKSTGQVSTAAKCTWDANDTSYGGFMYLTSAPQHRSDASMQNEATIRALNKVADSKTNLAVMFAEKAKTSQLILNTANRIYNAMRAFRRGDVKGIANYLGIAPGKLHNSWLEYKYGWMPLLMDVKNSAEFFAQQHVGRPIRFTTTSKIGDPITYRVSQPGFNRNGFGSNLETIVYNTEQYKFCRVKLWCEISNPELSQLQQLGLTNPALVAWELIPYSFVFDWFIHVGDWMNALTALHGVTLRKAMVSFEYMVTGSSVETFPGYNGFYDVYAPWVLNRKVKIRKYSRDPLSVSVEELYPPTDFSLPSWQKIVTAIALLKSNSRDFSNTRI